jgi:uncharacterized protein YuzE
MRMTYDPAADAVYLYITEPSPDDAAVRRTEEVADGLMLDFDVDGHVVGVEILSVSRRPGAKPMQMAFEVLTERPTAEAA